MTTGTMTRTDREIRSAVHAELTRAGLDGIDVTVTGGVVTLTGPVDGPAARWAAERATQRVTRVRAVADDLAAPDVPATGRDDPALALAAVRALEWDAFLPVGALRVTVADGWVTLHGEVGWEYQRRAAERSVARLTGVRGLSNGITVRA
ncbi:hypothetical protein GCM10027186_22580 [Micromonospora schwarzwaldensis]